jgi:hypothetical protein
MQRFSREFHLIPEILFPLSDQLIDLEQKRILAAVVYQDVVQGGSARLIGGA